MSARPPSNDFIGFSLNIFSLNCQGFGPKLNDILNSFYKFQIDILFLQETFNIPTKIQERLSLEHPDLTLNFKHSGIPTQGGIGYLAKKTIKIEPIPTPSPFSERFSKFKITHGNLTIEILNLYAPAGSGQGNADFYKNINRFFIPKKDTPILILGDFNFVQNPEKDRSKASIAYKNESDISRQIFSEIASARKLIDAYRHFFPNGVGYTHFNKGCGIHSRLDRLYMHQDYSHLLTKFHPPTNMISDHFLIGLSLTNSPPPKWGFGHPKMNHFYLKLPISHLSIEELFGNYNLAKEFNDPINNWANYKKDFWATYKKIVGGYHANRKIRLEELYKKDQKDNEITNEIFKILNLPNELKKSSGSSYFEGVAEEDFLPLYNKSMAKRNSEKNINAIIENEIEITDKDNIINTVRNYYKDLYTSSSPLKADMDNFLDIPLPKIERAQAAAMDAFITPDEVRKAIAGSHTGKTPGPDGIPMEFYRDHTDRVAPLLAEVYNNILLRGEAHPDFNKSITTLLYKGKGVRKELKNWRPISLLNCDYKILTKVIASRISPVLPDLINPDQTCGIPGRNSFENLFNVSAVYDQFVDSNQKALIVTFDQEKAFDRLEHTYIEEVLKRFGFPDGVLKWYRIINKNAKAQININGHLSDPIDITRSVRQGCPWSMILYVLGIEPLGRRIDNDPDIKGVRTINTQNEFKKSQYADDSTPVLRDVKSYFLVKKLFEFFGKASGSKINDSKTKILPIGKWSNLDLRPIENLIKPSIEILGVSFGPNLDLLNWPATLAKCHGILTSWSSKYLTIKSKIYIVNTFVLSNIWHIARVISIKLTQINELQTAICRFIWGGFLESVCRETSYLHPLKGGLGVPSIKSKIEAFYLQRLVYAKLKLEARPTWVGHLIYHHGFTLRVIDPGFALNCYRRRVITATIDPSILSPLSAQPLDHLLSARGYDPRVWTQKKTRPFYDILISNHTPRVMVQRPRYPWRKIWTNVWKSSEFNRFERQFLFLQFHEALPTIHKHTPSIPSLDPIDGLCPFCRTYTETNEHLFFRCPALLRFRSQILNFVNTRPVLNGLFGTPNDFLNFITLDFENSTDRQFKTIAVYSFSYKCAIWKFRCAINMGAPPPTSQELTTKFNGFLRPIEYNE